MSDDNIKFPKGSHGCVNVVNNDTNKHPLEPGINATIVYVNNDNNDEDNKDK